MLYKLKNERSVLLVHVYHACRRTCAFVYIKSPYIIHSNHSSIYLVISITRLVQVADADTSEQVCFFLQEVDWEKR
jgi:hypothetical protein